MSDLFQSRRRCTRLFLMEVDNISAFDGRYKCSLLRVLDDSNRAFKCDTYTLVYQLDKGRRLLGGRSEEYHFSVFVCDWSNSVTIQLDKVKSEREVWDDAERVVKAKKINHPATPEKMKKVYEAQIRKAELYLTGE